MLPMNSRKVLIVEDEPHIADVVSTALSDAGFDPLTAGSGDSARLVLAVNPDVALIVLDVMLPGQTGFGFADQLRRDGSHTPILFLTARDSLDDKLRGLRSGDDYITKPFDIGELVARVEAVLRRSYRWSSTKDFVVAM